MCSFVSFVHLYIFVSKNFVNKVNRSDKSSVLFKFFGFFSRATVTIFSKYSIHKQCCMCVYTVFPSLHGIKAWLQCEQLQSLLHATALRWGEKFCGCLNAGVFTKRRLAQKYQEALSIRQVFVNTFKLSSTFIFKRNNNLTEFFLHFFSLIVLCKRPPELRI